jgi:hypothetical protein
MKIFHSWSDDDLERLVSQPWEIDGDNDWFKEDLWFTDLLLDDWTCDTIIESITKDIEEKLSVAEILKKYVKS